MFGPIELNDYAKSRQQEMINEAATYRRFHKEGASVKQLGRMLVRLGQKLNGEPTVKARPALNVK